jgi:beta-lactamase regulating signal transducer with metallopeptidase domain
MRDLLPHLLAFLATWWLHAAVLITLALVGLRLAGPVAARTKERFLRVALLGSLVSVLVATAWPLAGPRIEALPARVSPATPLERVEPAAAWEVAPAALPVPPAVLAPPAPAKLQVTASTPVAPFPWLPAALGLWVLFALGATLRAVLSLRALRARLGVRTPVDDAGYLAALKRLSEGAGLHSAPKLTRFAGDGVPVVLGCWRAEISVPVHALTLSSSARDALLAHEVAHVKRRDAVWLRVYALLGALLPLNPLVRLATRRLRTLAEQICDEQAVAWTRDPIGLAECLVTAASWMGAPTRTHLVPAMARDSRMLKQRVDALLREQPVRRAPARLTLLCVALLAAPLLLPAVVEAGADELAKASPPMPRRAPVPPEEHKPAYATPLRMPRFPDPPELDPLFLELGLSALQQDVSALQREVRELLPLLERMPASPARDRLRSGLAARLQRIEAEMQAAIAAHAESKKEGAK